MHIPKVRQANFYKSYRHTHTSATTSASLPSGIGFPFSRATRSRVAIARSGIPRAMSNLGLSGSHWQQQIIDVTSQTQLQLQTSLLKLSKQTGQRDLCDCSTVHVTMSMFASGYIFYDGHNHPRFCNDIIISVQSAVSNEHFGHIFSKFCIKCENILNFRYDQSTNNVVVLWAITKQDERAFSSTGPHAWTLRLEYVHSDDSLITLKRLLTTLLLHFVWVADDAKCIVVMRVCVSVCPRPYAHTIARTRM